MGDDFPPSSLQAIASEVASLLKSKGESVAVAETAAGGLISASLLAQPGASKYYKGGLTLYTLPSRIQFADWTNADIQAYQGPTTDIVAKLAASTRQKLDSTYCIGESGTAGPTGGKTRTREPGFCALAVDAGDRGSFKKEIETHSNDRTANMVDFAREALELLKDVIEGKAKL